jgi:hypothetical protein
VNPGTVLFDPAAPVAAAVAPVKPKKVKVEEALVVGPKTQAALDLVARHGLPVIDVESASSETKQGTSHNPVARATVNQGGRHMLNTKNLAVTIEGSTIHMTITDPKYRGEVTATGKSRKVAWAGGTVDIGDGLRMNVSITKDGAKV